MFITVHRDGQNYGPYTLDQVKEYLTSGKLQLTDFAYYEGVNEWVPLSAIPSLLSSPRTSTLDCFPVDTLQKHINQPSKLKRWLVATSLLLAVSLFTSLIIFKLIGIKNTKIANSKIAIDHEVNSLTPHDIKPSILSAVVAPLQSLTTFGNTGPKSDDTQSVSAGASPQAGNIAATSLFNTGNALQQKGDLVAAIQAYSKSIDIDPTFPDVYLNRGVAKANNKDYGGAIKDFTKFITLQPDSAIGYFNRAESRSSNNDLDGAIKDYDKVTELSPDNIAAYVNRASNKVANNDFDGAVDDYTKAIPLDPSNPQIYFYRAVAETRKNDTDDAIADYKKSIDLDPDNTDSYMNLGLIYYNRHDWDSAVNIYKRAAEIPNDNPYAHFYIWLITARQHGCEAANADLRTYLGYRLNAKPTADWQNAIGNFLVAGTKHSGEAESSFLKAAATLDHEENGSLGEEANFFAGTKHLINGDIDAAKDDFNKCMTASDKWSSSYTSAKAELQFLKNDNEILTRSYDDQTPLDLIKTGVKSGNPSAQYQLGIRLLAGKARSEEVAKIFEGAYYDGAHLIEQESNRQANSMDRYHAPTDINILMAIKHDFTIQKDVVLKESAEAIPLLESAASQNYLDAITTLSDSYAKGVTEPYGCIFVNGDSVNVPLQKIPVDTDKAFYYAHIASNLGSPLGMKQLGICYASGIGTTKDINAAVNWLGKAWQNGNKEAAICLIQILEEGGIDGHDDGYSRDIKRGFIISRELSLADSHYVNQVEIHTYVYKAIQTLPPEDLLNAEAQALTEITKRAQRDPSKTTASSVLVNDDIVKDDPKAQYDLAIRLLNGNARSKAAVDLLTLVSKEYIPADEHNNVLPYVSKLYEAVIGGEIKRALALLADAAAKQNVDALVELSQLYSDDSYIQVNVADNYTLPLKVLVTHEDFEKSWSYAQKAAELGSAVGMRRLGICYGMGHGVKKDINTCVYWLQKACDRQDLQSYFILSQILCDGGINGHDDGYPKDPKRAYLFGSILQSISSPFSTEQQWGGESMSKARPFLKADDLIDATAEAQNVVKKIKLQTQSQLTQ